MVTLLYQLLPRLWGDGNSLCGGFRDIDAGTLRYLKGLGVSHLWLTGLPRHSTLWSAPGFPPSNPLTVKGEAGSPYAVTDWYDLCPYLADNHFKRDDEFSAMVDRIHSEGLRLIMDFIPNHVARQYDGARTPRGLARLGEGDDKSVHWKAENDFFYYPGHALSLPGGDGGAYTEDPARASGNHFGWAPGPDDWYDTVKLNYCDFHTATWDKMTEVLLYWCSRGVDGFRCDMVELVPPEFMRYAIEKTRKAYPETVFIAEAYQTDRYGLYLDEVGFDLLYDKSGLYDSLRAITAGKASASEITALWQRDGRFSGRLLNFLENHDEQRIASDFFAGRPENGYAALGVSLLLGKTPFMLYFGQEVGERGMDDEPYSGVNGRTSIFDWWKVKSINALYNHIHGRGPCPSPQVMKRYSDALELRREPAFAEGAFYDLQYCQDGAYDRDRQFAWLRGVPGGTLYLLVSNFSDESRRVGVRIPPEAFSFFGHEGDDIVYQTVPGKDFSVSAIR